MSILDRIKRRLPIVSGPPPARPAAPAATPAPRRAPPPEPERAAPASARGGKPVAAYLDETVKGHPVVLFMKGTPSSPLCGFSANAAGILAEYKVPLHTVDVIADPEVRDAVKQYSNWPTLPQVYVGGEFVGGSDVLAQLHASGELRELITKATAPAS